MIYGIGVEWALNGTTTVGGKVMENIEERILKSFAENFLRDGDAAEHKVTAIEGVDEKGDLGITVLMVTDEFLLMKVRRGKGLIDPPHTHDDHVSVGMLLSGRMRMIIGDDEFTAEPGSVWRHPPGVVHYSEALEDCVQIEVKSPPCRTWD